MAKDSSRKSGCVTTHAPRNPALVGRKYRIRLKVVDPPSQILHCRYRAPPYPRTDCMHTVVRCCGSHNYRQSHPYASIPTRSPALFSSLRKPTKWTSRTALPSSHKNNKLYFTLRCDTCEYVLAFRVTASKPFHECDRKGWNLEMTIAHGRTMLTCYVRLIRADPNPDVDCSCSTLLTNPGSAGD